MFEAKKPFSFSLNSANVIPVTHFCAPDPGRQTPVRTFPMCPPSFLDHAGGRRQATAFPPGAGSPEGRERVRGLPFVRGETSGRANGTPQGEAIFPIVGPQ